MIDSICICGAGTMGSGIAQVAAQSGCPTILFDLDETMLLKAKNHIGQNTQTLVERNKMTAGERTQVLSLLHFTNDIHECVAGIVIEAIVEKIEPKSTLFRQLATINSPETIFASNTSSLSITTLAENSSRPENVIGMHFFNPAPVMKLVEVVNTRYTLHSNTEKIIALAKKMGKIPVSCQDAPGFIVNHVARPYYLEALRLLELGIASIETIDLLMEASGFKMGPFKLMDLIGNDINYAVTCSVYEGMQQTARLKPSSIQRLKVEQGALGKKTGQGYYPYT